jgi:hypothetical protein
MEEDRGKAFTHLYTALTDFQTKFIDGSVKAVGFFLIVLGWALTSAGAQRGSRARRTRPPIAAVPQSPARD